jgi:hypothetical protein
MLPFLELEPRTIEFSYWKTLMHVSYALLFNNARTCGPGDYTTWKLFYNPVITISSSIITKLTEPLIVSRAVHLDSPPRKFFKAITIHIRIRIRNPQQASIMQTLPSPPPR